VDWLKRTFPSVLFTASAGGMRTGIRTAMKMKAAGYVAGCPDLLIFEPRGRYHGLAIELKADKGRPDSDGNQKRFIDALCQRKYYADFCYGVEHAKKSIMAYLNHGEAASVA
jgi:hypothetical protein